MPREVAFVVGLIDAALKSPSLRATLKGSPFSDHFVADACFDVCQGLGVDVGIEELESRVGNHDPKGLNRLELSVLRVGDWCVALDSPQHNWELPVDPARALAFPTPATLEEWVKGQLPPVTSNTNAWKMEWQPRRIRPSVGLKTAQEELQKCSTASLADYRRGELEEAWESHSTPLIKPRPRF